MSKEEGKVQKIKLIFENITTDRETNRSSGKVKVINNNVNVQFEPEKMTNSNDNIQRQLSNDSPRLKNDDGEIDVDSMKKKLDEEMKKNKELLSQVQTLENDVQNLTIEHDNQLQVKEKLIQQIGDLKHKNDILESEIQQINLSYEYYNVSNVDKNEIPDKGLMISFGVAEELASKISKLQYMILENEYDYQKLNIEFVKLKEGYNVIDNMVKYSENELMSLQSKNSILNQQFNDYHDKVIGYEDTFKNIIGILLSERENDLSKKINEILAENGFFNSPKIVDRKKKSSKIKLSTSIKRTTITRDDRKNSQ